MKQAIEWSDALAIGVEVIDDQHKNLIERLNRVSVALASNQGEKEVASTLDFLIKYTDYHFSEEEKYMEKYNYPGLAEQKEKHDIYKKLLTQLEEEFIEDGASKALANSIDTLLINWLTKHIEGIDVKFGKFLQEKNIAIQAE
jgi:hemerythrin